MPGDKSLSGYNPFKMNELYLPYYKIPKLPPLVAEIEWSKNYIIKEKCKDNLQREFYLNMTCIIGWLVFQSYRIDEN